MVFHWDFEGPFAKRINIHVNYTTAPEGFLPPFFNSQGYLRDGLVALVTILQAENNPLAGSSAKGLYGEPTQSTYSYYQQGSMTYLYPKRGLAFVASPEYDVAFIRECFAPIGLDEYMNAGDQVRGKPPA